MSGRSTGAAAALAAARPSVFWLDDPARPPVLPALAGALDADLVFDGCSLADYRAVSRRRPGSSVFGPRGSLTAGP